MPTGVYRVHSHHHSTVAFTDSVKKLTWTENKLEIITPIAADTMTAALNALNERHPELSIPEWKGPMMLAEKSDSVRPVGSCGAGNTYIVNALLNVQDEGHGRCVEDPDKNDRPVV